MVRPIALMVAAAFLPAPLVWALPNGEQVVAGSAQVSRPTAQSMVVQQNSARAIVNWQGFSIGAAESVSFRQPSTSSVMLNRVVGSQASELLGSLTANGRIFLVNPNGVLFGPGASVDVGGLIASTLNIRDDDFMADRYRFFATGAGGSVLNAGTLRAGAGGTVALLGGQVQNDGTIEVKLGTAALASGSRVTLDFAGDGLTKVTIDEGALAAEVRNRGAIVADGGQALLTARAAGDLVRTVVNQSGVVRAASVVERDGRIFLEGGSNGRTVVSGTLDASGRADGAKGGEVRVLGREVELADGASIDASGQRGGGTVLVGGDYQGRNAEVQNAAAATVAAGASVRADALGAGHGGRVIVWSDGATRVDGSLSAQGGPVGGDGGFVETSGARLTVGSSARVTTAAPRGRPGQWLLDPTDLDIDSYEGIVHTYPDGGVVDANVVSAALAGGDVTLSTGVPPDSGYGGTINVWASIIKGSGTGRTKLTLLADQDIFVNNDVQITSTAGPLDVDLISRYRQNDFSASGQIIMYWGSAIRTNGGDVLLSGGTDPRAPGNGRAFSPAGFGVALIQSTIDTTSASGSPGSIEVRGQGGTWPGGDGILGPIPEGNGQMGIWSWGAYLAGGRVTLDGIGGYGYGSDPGVVRGGSGVVLGSGSWVSASTEFRAVGRGGDAVSDNVEPRIAGHGVVVYDDSYINSPSIRLYGVGGNVVGDYEGQGGMGVDVRSSGTLSGGDIELIGTGGRGAESAADGTGGRGVSLVSSSYGGSVSGWSLTVEGTGGLGNASSSGTSGTGGVGAYVAGYLVIDGDLSITGTGGNGSSGTGGVGGRGVWLLGETYAASASLTGTGGVGSGSASATAGTGGTGVHMGGTLSVGGTVSASGTGGLGSAGADGSGGRGITVLGDLDAVWVTMEGTGGDGSSSTTASNGSGGAGVYMGAQVTAGSGMSITGTGGRGSAGLLGTGGDGVVLAGATLTAGNTIGVNGFGGTGADNPSQPSNDGVGGRGVAILAADMSSVLRVTADAADCSYCDVTINGTGGRGSTWGYSGTGGDGIEISESNVLGPRVELVGTGGEGIGPSPNPGSQVELLASSGGQGVRLWRALVEAGDSFRLSGTGGSSETRWYFYDPPSTPPGDGTWQLYSGYVATGVSLSDTTVRATGVSPVYESSVEAYGNIEMLVDGDNTSISTAGNGRLTLFGWDVNMGSTEAPYPAWIQTDAGELTVWANTWMSPWASIRSTSGNVAIYGSLTMLGDLSQGASVQSSTGSIVASGYKLSMDSLASIRTGKPTGQAILVDMSGGVRVASGARIGSPTTGGDIFVRAGSDARYPSGSDGLQLDGDAANPSIQTTGTVGIASQDAWYYDSATGQSSQVPTDILIGGPAPAAGTSSFLHLAQSELSAIQYGSGRLPIGSPSTGAVMVRESLYVPANLSLQAGDGAGRALSIEAPLSVGSGTLTLMAGGAISQQSTAPIAAPQLLVRSTGGTVMLEAPGNATPVASIHAGGGESRFQTSGPLELRSVTGQQQSDGGIVTPLTQANSFAQGDFLARNTGEGNGLTLGQNIATGGSAIVLVTDGVFDNSGNYALTPGGGDSWTIWAADWVGENRGGLVPTSPLPNLYGCSWNGGSPVCPSGVTLPATGNRFVYQERPTVSFYGVQASREYGLPNPTLVPPSASGVLTGLGDTAADAIQVAPPVPGPTTDVGTYPVTYQSPSGYLLNSLTAGSLTVTPAPLTVTYIATPATRQYGAANPPLTGSVSASGLRNAQTLGDVTSGAASFSTTAAQGSAVGLYPIIGSGLSAATSNYSFEFVQAPGNATAFSVTQAQGVVTVVYTADAKVRLYGDPNPALTGSVSAVGLVDGETVSSITTGTPVFTTSATVSSGVGSYSIVGSGLTAITDNYASVLFTQAPGNASALRIDPAAAVTVTYLSDPRTRLYGDPNPALTGTVSAAGLKAGDTLASVTTGSATFSTPATAQSDVGAYAIDGSGLAGSTANYAAVNFVQAPGNASALTVAPAPLTVTYAATPASREYGLANPALTGAATAEGLRNGQALSQVTSGAASFSTTAVPSSNVGSYPIDGSGLSAASGNYSFSFVQAPGNASALSVTPAPLTINYVATPVSREYGLANPVLTGAAAAEGLRNGQTLAQVTTGTASFATNAAPSSNVGSYPIDGTGLAAASGNYSFSFVQAPGNASAFTVTQAPPVTVTYAATTASREYGLANPALSGSVSASGLRAADTLASVTSGAATFATTATPASNVGSYPVAGSGLAGSTANYAAVNFQQAPGNASALTVTQAPAVTVTYTATPASREYGLDNPVLTGGTSASGLRAADTIASVTSGAATFATTATPASNVGSYPIAGSGLAGATANYAAVNFQQAPVNASALTVTPAPVTVTYVATRASREYGLDNPVLAGNVSASGLRNGQTLSQVTAGSASFATTATPASDVGTYPIGGAGLSAASGNYSFAFVQAPANATAFRIDPATLVMTADPVYRYAGSPNPEITGTVTGFRQGDTQQSATTGTLFFTTVATATSAPGAYFAAGQGLSARNYLLVDSPANAQGVIVVPAPVTGGDVPVVGNPRNPESEPTYTYDRNFGPVGMCMAVGPLASPTGVAPGADVLELEWPRVRGRPNLTNCVGVSDRDFCRDF